MDWQNVERVARFFITYIDVEHNISKLTDEGIRGVTNEGKSYLF